MSEQDQKQVMMKAFKKKNLALCIDAGEYEGVSLFAMKIYEFIPDPLSEADGFLRVIDEEGEPYYYDARAFLKVKSAQRGLSIPFVQSRRSQKKHVTAKQARR